MQNSEEICSNACIVQEDFVPLLAEINLKKNDKIMISAANALRPGEPLTDEEMKNRVCTCPENPDVDEWGDNSWLPCMSIEMGLYDIGLRCNTCIYCQPKR